MRPESLELKNYRSYAEASIDLSGVRLGAISGEMGSGKSSLMEATLFALTGASTRGSLDSWIRDEEEECDVTLVFSVAAGRYKVARTRSRRGSGKSTAELVRDEGGTWVPEATGADAVTARIEELLGADERLLLMTSFIAQEDAKRFLELQPAKRIEAFNQILALNAQYGPVEQHWKSESERLKSELEDTRREIERLEADAAEVEGRTEELNRARNDLADAKFSLSASEGDLELARVAAEQSRENARLVEQARKLADERDRLVSQIAIKAELEKQLADRDQVLVTIGALETEEREAAKASEARAVVEADLRAAKAALAETNSAGTPKALEVTRLTDQIRGLEERLENIHGTDAPVCDRCGQAIADEALERTTAQLSAELETAINGRNTVSQEAEALRERYAEQQEQVKALEQQLADMPAPRNVAGDLQTAKNNLSLLDAIPARLATIEAAEGRKSEVESELEALQAQGIDPSLRVLDGTAEHEFSALRDRIATLRESVSSHERQIARHEEAIAMLAKSAARLQELKGETRGLEEACADAELLRKAFSKWGIPSLIVGNVLLALEREVNELLAFYEKDLSIHFEGTKETRDGARDSLEILVSRNGFTRSYETCSGGQKFCVASCVRLGLALLLAHRSGARVETLMMDEPDGLDAAARQNLVAILNHLSDRFALILLMSHHEDLRDAFPSQILVSLDESGLSQVEVAA